MAANDHRAASSKARPAGASSPIRDRRIAARVSGSFGSGIKGGLRYVRAGELIPNPKRWRIHTDAEGRGLVANLRAIGHATACIAMETPEGLVLLDGHLRRELDPEGMLPVLVLKVTAEEGDLLLATLDPISAMAVPDPDALAALLAEVAIPEEELLERLRALVVDPAPTAKGDPEDIPSKPTRSRVRPGQLWALGPHRLLCGDARRPEDLERLMGQEMAHVMWTDPPYGVDYEGKTPQALTIENDHPDDLQRLLTEAFGAADRYLRPGARLYVAHPAGALQLTFVSSFFATGWRLHQTLIWAKDSLVMGHADYHYRHEPILYGYKSGPGRWGRGGKGWYGGNGQDSIFEIPRPKASREHPTAKPVELVARCLANSSRRHDLVLDPFAGSGATLMACQELSRRCRALEIDPRYAQVIITRWESFTGERAERLDG